MRQIVYASLTLAALNFAGVSVDAVLAFLALAFLALAAGTAYMNRDAIARSLTRRAFRAARRFERGTRARRAMFRTARRFEAYASRAEAEIRAEGLA